MPAGPREASLPPMGIVEARSVRKTYDAGSVEVQALRGVDLTLARGEMVAIKRGAVRENDAMSRRTLGDEFERLEFERLRLLDRDRRLEAVLNVLRRRSDGSRRQRVPARSELRGAIADFGRLEPRARNRSLSR